MRSGDNLFLWTLCLTSGWRKRKTSVFHPEGWGAPDCFAQGSVPGVPHPPALCSLLCWRGTQLVLLAGCITGTSALQKVIGRKSLRLVVVVVAATLSPGRVVECMSRPPMPAVLLQQASHWRCLEGI